MKKTFLLPVLIFSFLSQTFSQDFFPVMKEIKGNILLVGVEHSGTIYEYVNGHPQNASLFGERSKDIFCSILPEILKASKGKSIVFMIESVKPEIARTVSMNVVKNFKLPTCFPIGDTLVGCDPRPDSIKIQTAIVDLIVSPLYLDGLDGTEKTLQEGFLKNSFLDLSKLDKADIEYIYYWGKVTARYNKAFETAIVKMARVLERRGHYVVVLCGAAHVAKIIHEQKQKDIGYVLCLDPILFKQVLSAAKLMTAMEQFAK